MRVLVTGSRGLIGSAVMEELENARHAALGFDLRDGQDVLQPATLSTAMRGCDAVVHAAALLGTEQESADQIMAVNLQGTWNVLCAAEGAQVKRVVFLSSVDALGVFKGERPPDYLPLDGAHPCYPSTPYGISKYLAEEMCRCVAESSDMRIVALRPPGVWTKDTYGMIVSERTKRREFEWSPFWEYGAFIDIRDLSYACLQALTCDVESYHCILVTSADITTSGAASRELAQLIHPDVEWRGGAAYDSDPYLTLVDIEPARRLLGWSPRHTWRKAMGDGV
jgi:nucleoside-diphosphate-sugar epimerase